MWSYARRGAGVPLIGSREQRAGSGVLYRLGQSTPHVIMPIRPRLSRLPRILIASDQNHALSDVVRSLGRRGYSVLRVFADASVLERARTARPDVIVLDAALGEGQALDLSRTLRADPSIGSSTPILLLVPSRPGHQDHLSALRAGVWELVRQPLDVAELLGKLDRYVLVKVERDGVSRRLEGGGGRSDAIGRIGPAEFAVVAAGVNRAGARQLANRLRDSVGVELRAGYDAIGSRRAGALEGRGLLARAARALEMAKLEGKWVKEARE